MAKNLIKSTTIVGIRKNKSVVIAGDGQASLGNTVMKANVKMVCLMVWVVIQMVLYHMKENGLITNLMEK